MSNHPFVIQLNALAKEIHATAVSKGWWDPAEWYQRIQKEVLVLLPEELQKEMEKAAYRRPAEGIALMHAELSEALENERAGCPSSDHIPEFTGVEEEYADTIIRILDDAERRGLRVGEAIIAKMEFNKNRPFRHGGKRI